MCRGYVKLILKGAGMLLSLLLVSDVRWVSLPRKDNAFHFQIFKLLVDACQRGAPSDELGIRVFVRSKKSTAIEHGAV